MKRVIVIILILVLGGTAFWFLRHQKKLVNGNNQPVVNSMPMKITSPAFLDNQNIPSKYTCDGEGVNPPLEFLDVPKEAVSLALIMDDPDAPVGTWTHWTIWNIIPSTDKILENSVPQGAVQGKGSSGQNNYGGPCPPSGTHRYIFNLFALDAKLKIPSYSSVDGLKSAMSGHILQQATLTGLYSRSK